MNAIVAVDEDWGIGRNGKLLAHLPGDLKYFKEKTLGKTIIIGRETFSSMSGKLLAGRETVILTRDPGFKQSCPVVHSLEEAFEYTGKMRSGDIFVAGGENVYRQFLPYCDKIFTTKLYASFGADRFFPNLDERRDEFSVKQLSGILEENDVKYQFFEYLRKK